MVSLGLLGGPHVTSILNLNSFIFLFPFTIFLSSFLLNFHTWVEKIVMYLYLFVFRSLSLSICAAHQILSFLQNPMAQESISSHHANSTERPVSSTKESQVSDAIILDSSEDGRPSQSQSSEPHHRSVENIEPSNIVETANPNPPDILSLKGKFY